MVASKRLLRYNDRFGTTMTQPIADALLDCLTAATWRCSSAVAPIALQTARIVLSPSLTDSLRASAVLLAEQECGQFIAHVARVAASAIERTPLDLGLCEPLFGNLRLDWLHKYRYE